MSHNQKQTNDDQNKLKNSRLFNYAAIGFGIFTLFIVYGLFYKQVLFFPERNDLLKFGDIYLPPTYTVTAFVFALMGVGLFLAPFIAAKQIWDKEVTTIIKSSHRLSIYGLLFLIPILILIETYIATITFESYQAKASIPYDIIIGFGIILVILSVIVSTVIYNKTRPNDSSSNINLGQIFPEFLLYNAIPLSIFALFFIVLIFVCFVFQRLWQPSAVVLTTVITFIIVNTIWIIAAITVPYKLINSKWLYQNLIFLSALICSLSAIYNASYHTTIIHDMGIGQHKIVITPNKKTCEQLRKININCQPNKDKTLWLKMVNWKGIYIISKNKHSDRAIALPMVISMPVNKTNNDLLSK